MTAENFLEQYGDITAKIRRKQRLKENLEAQTLNVTSHLTPDKVQSSGSLQKIAEAVEEALDLEVEIKELFPLKNKVRKEIESVLDRVSFKRAEVLHAKYLLLKSKEDIMLLVDRSETTVDKWIKEGKEEVQCILDTRCSEITENTAK